MSQKVYLDEKDSSVAGDMSEQPVNLRLSGAAKSSILLIALGQDLSSQILEQLTPEEVERLTTEIVHTKKIDNKTRAKVLEECQRELREQVNLGGLDYARSILENVLGPAKTQELLGKLTSSGAGVFRWLRSVNPNQLASVLRGEKPQVVALVLGHLPPEIAALVVSSLPEKLAGEVALRLTTMQPTDPEVIKHLDKVLLSQLSLGDNASLTEVGGTRSVVEILNFVDRSTEKKILDHLAEVDEKIANEIKEMMFVFEDILGLDDRSIQTILRDVPQEDLRLALKGVSNEIREVFFRNMSQRAAESLKEDLEVSGPVRLKDVEAAQSRISNIARALDEKGEISIRGRSDDVVV